MQCNLKGCKLLPIFENFRKIVQALRRVKFGKISKYQEQCQSLIAQLLIYCMTEKIANAYALIYTAINSPAVSQSQ